jgi:LmbE family N-acetylglucosaminyl deacetylase
MTAETPRPVSYRAYIDLISSRAGLAEAMLALQGRESSAITALRDTLADADPAEIDAALREVIRAAQKARKALKGDVA